MSTELTDNQVRGYKSTISNRRASDEAKKRAQKVLAGEAAPNRLGPRTDGEEFQHRHLGGKKATLKSTVLSSCICIDNDDSWFIDPNTSEEAKQQAQEELDDATSAHYNAARDVDDHEEEIHSHRVLGGYKATLKACVRFACAPIRTLIPSRTPT
jgi:hypothetical protein